jgi:hypothetical protein
MALAATTGCSWARLLALTASKRHDRGGFQNKIFLEYVEDPGNSN